jgi:8-oxo-dGTP diphosphatase
MTVSVTEQPGRYTRTRRYAPAGMALYLVRHGKAGSRHGFDGPDRLRPLTPGGHAQAEAIAAHLDGHEIVRVLSSPYVRCVQTVAPLAERRGLAVEPHDALVEGRPFAPVLALLAGAADGTVACTHGDVLPDVLEALMRRGTVIDGPGDIRKGVVWVLERDADAVTRAHAIPPP